MPFRLWIVGADTSVPVSLPSDRCIVGRAPDADIRIDDALASRKHALLQRRHGRLFICDFAVRNPTRVNDKPIRGETEIFAGDTLLIGSTRIEVGQRADVRVRVRPTTRTREVETTVAIDTPALTVDDVDATTTLVERIARSMQVVWNNEDAAELWLGLCNTLVPNHCCVITLLDDDDTLHVIAASGAITPGAVIDVTKRLLSQLRTKRDIVCIRQTQGTEEASLMLAVVAPILVAGQLRGLVYAARRPQNDWPKRDLALLRAMTSMIATRIETLERVQALEEKMASERAKAVPADFVGNSPAILELERRASSHPASRGFVVLGEAGSGKLAFARWIHNKTCHSREPGRFLSIDFLDNEETVAAARTAVEELLGASLPEDSTLCLRNVLHASQGVQADLAALLADRACRLIVTSRATKTDFYNQVDASLAALLAPQPYEIPPLRQRAEDLELLVDFFCIQAARDYRIPVATLSPRSFDRLRMHGWPGNVEELRRAIENAAMRSGGAQIMPKHLPKLASDVTNEAQAIEVPSLEEVERMHILHVLEVAGGNKVLASKFLGIANSTLYEKMKKYGIQS